MRKQRHWSVKGSEEKQTTRGLYKQIIAATTVFSQYEEHKGPIAFQLPQKMEVSLIPCFQWKENVQCTNCALGKTWLMQLLLKKRQQQHWHVFYSGPAFKHLPLHFKYVHMHVLILKWDFSSIKHAKRLSLAGSIALVMLLNSHPYVPDWHNRKFSFPKPRNFRVVQTVAESSVLKTTKLWFT